VDDPTPANLLPLPEALPPPLEWALHYLPEFFSEEPSAFHAALFADLLEPARRLIARVAPRGHAKSTCASFAFPLWCICTQRRRNIVIVTHEASLATQFVRDIRDELECNEQILEDYGDLCHAEVKGARRKRASQRQMTDQDVGPPEQHVAVRRSNRVWTQDKFTTVTGITVQAKSSGSSFRGLRTGPHRPDLVICDDLEKDEQVESPEARRKLEQWLRRVVLPALAPDGQVIVVGSIIHYDSLLANLRDRQRWPRWDYRVYRALEARACGPDQFELAALWPARWPVARLREERERVGTMAFEQEYMANPIDDTLRVFRPEWLRTTDPPDLAERDLIPLMAVDPATGAAGGDYFALWVGLLDRSSGVIFSRVLSLERIGIVQQVERIVAAFRRWRPVRIGIESVAYQVALQDILKERGRRMGLYLPVIPLYTAVNKRARIEGTAPLFADGTFRLPPDLHPDVEAQFLHFPKARHDDAPDVCAMGIEIARTLRTAAAAGGVGARRGSYERDGGW